MNNVKYIHPKTGKRVTVTVTQNLSLSQPYNERGKSTLRTLPQANREMAKAGFVRSGVRSS